MSITLSDIVQALPTLSREDVEKLQSECISVLASDTYATHASLYTFFGTDNVRKWANLDNYADDHEDYGPYITLRMDDALLQATVEMQEKLRPSGLALDPAVDTIPKSYERCCAYKAGVMLYEGRGVDDYDYESGKLVHRYAFINVRADQILDDIVQDRRRSDLQGVPLPIRAPGVIK